MVLINAVAGTWRGIQPRWGAPEPDHFRECDLPGFSGIHRHRWKRTVGAREDLPSFRDEEEA